MASEAADTTPSRLQSAGGLAGVHASGSRLPWRALGLLLCLAFLFVSAASNVLEAYYVYVAPMTAGDLGAQLVREGAGPHEVEARH